MDTTHYTTYVTTKKKCDKNCKIERRTCVGKSRGWLRIGCWGIGLGGL